MKSKDDLLDLVNLVRKKREETKKQHDAVALQHSDVRQSTLCRLWAGMGHIYKMDITNKNPNNITADPNNASIIIKHVTPPSQRQQSFGDQRKAVSYQVEANFYDKVAPVLRSKHKLSIPEPYLVKRGPSDGEIIICMSYLEGHNMDADSKPQVHAVLSWLARLHASYWGNENIDKLVADDAGLHEVGSYWYLDTRPDEHESMSRMGWEGRLRRAARAMDLCLKRDPMQCLIHGDVKDANVVIVQGDAALYDFQYCGKGSPTRDLAYFLCSSTFPENELDHVTFYHERLREELRKMGIEQLEIPTLQHLKRSLEVAFCDYCRFMAGWGYWGFDIKDRVRSILDEIDGGKDLGSDDAYDEAIRKSFW